MGRSELCDADYFRARALEEQDAAQKATCAEARERHDELATMFRFRAAMLTTHPRCWAEEYAKRAEAEEV